MSSDTYFKDFKEFHDKYTDFYNSQKNSLIAFSELASILSGVIDIREFIRSELKMKFYSLKDSFLREAVRLRKDGWSTPPKVVEAEVSMIDTTEIDSYFDRILNSFAEATNAEAIRESIIKRLNKFGKVQENRIYSDELDSVIDLLKELQKITPNYHSLRFLNSKILIRKYPEKIESFSKLSGKEKQELTKVGRPLSKDLPQTDVEDFVKNKLYPNGKKTDSKKFTHANGNPNWRQLTLAYLDAYPEIEKEEIITFRRLQDRVKMAYDNIIKSMK